MNGFPDRRTSQTLCMAALALLLQACAKALPLGSAPSGAPPATEFHWPPPEPTVLNDLSGNERASIDSCKTRYGVASRLEAVLDKAGYADRKFYLVHTDAGLMGFVVTTRLEQINADGAPKLGTERWSAKFPSADALGFLEYLKELVIPVSGHYRVLLFAVTSLPITSTVSAPTLVQVKDWLKQGTANVPAELRAFGFSPDDENVGLYVYEFSSSSADDPAMFVETSNSILTGAMHLTKSGISTALMEETAPCLE